MYTNGNSYKRQAVYEWVNQLAPWRVIAHHTFVWESSIWATQKSYERFMAKELPGVSYFYAIEQNPNRLGHHVHALWADCEGVHRSEIWQRWMDRYGRNRIEPVRDCEDVAGYCSKYVTKEGAWWNVRLVAPELFHRNKRLHAEACAQAIASAKQRPVAV